MMKLLLLIGVASAKIGVDVSSSVSESDFQCLQEPGGEGSIEYVLVRIYQSTGTIDRNGANTMKAATSAGIKTVDAYMFPCVSCGDAAGQVNSAFSALSGVSYNKLWLDIEKYNWSSDTSTNQAFIEDMLSACSSRKCGIYTSYYNWESIVGLDYNKPASSGYPLWYAHYDNSASFSDFTPFGGWSSPTIKQYKGDATSCGVGIDYNYAASYGAAINTNFTSTDDSAPKVSA